MAFKKYYYLVLDPCRNYFMRTVITPTTCARYSNGGVTLLKPKVFARYIKHDFFEMLLHQNELADGICYSQKRLICSSHP